MKNTEIRLLRADEIECWVGTINERGLSLLLYKDARVDQKILDEAFGMYGWERTHQSIEGNLYCTVRIWDSEKAQWIEKQDVGTTSYTEKEKGQASDAFKRACVNVGIGRELYSAPYIFIPTYKIQMKEKNGKKSVKDNFYVSEISISPEKVITELSILNQRKEEVFRWKQPKNVLTGGNSSEWQELYREMERTKVPEEMLLKRYGVNSIYELDEVTRKKALNGLKRSRTVA